MIKGECGMVRNTFSAAADPRPPRLRTNIKHIGSHPSSHSHSDNSGTKHRLMVQLGSKTSGEPIYWFHQGWQGGGR